MTADERPIAMVADAEAIGCSLAAGAMDERLDEWRALAASARARVRTDEAIRLTFTAVDRRSPADLVEREHACCPFLSFTTELTPVATSLQIRGPVGCGELFAELF